jgi:hypothetical protein
MRDQQLEAACALQVELRKIQAQNKITLRVSFPGEQTLVVTDGDGKLFASQFGANATIQMNLLRECLGEICKQKGLLYE